MDPDFRQRSPCRGLSDVVPKLSISQNGGTLGTTRFWVAKGTADGRHVTAPVSCVCGHQSFDFSVRVFGGHALLGGKAAEQMAAGGVGPRLETGNLRRLRAASDQRASHSREEEGPRKHRRGQRDRPVVRPLVRGGSRQAGGASYQVVKELRSGEPQSRVAPVRGGMCSHVHSPASLWSMRRARSSNFLKHQQ